MRPDVAENFFSFLLDIAVCDGMFRRVATPLLVFLVAFIRPFMFALGMLQSHYVPFSLVLIIE